MKHKQTQNRRYYLHRKTRGLGFTLSAKRRTLFIPYTQADDDLMSNKYIAELARKYKYNLQLEIC